MSPGSKLSAAPRRSSEFVEIPLAAGVRLWVLPDKRFKNVSVRAWLHRPLDARATETALLPAVLRRGYRRQPTPPRLSAVLPNLYRASYAAGVPQAGQRHPPPLPPPRVA